jgi:hypothetical protein
MTLLTTLPLRHDATSTDVTAGATILRAGPKNPAELDIREAMRDTRESLRDGRNASRNVREASRDAREASRGTAQDMYFFTSIEDFPPDIGDLGLTHDDAQGFYEYVQQFNAPNGWYRDSSVGQWIYEETYDNYLDDYGFDAARVVYHSGHGSMDDNGVFWLPVGNDWGGDVWTSSNDMRLGNEYARYAFWSTCLSLRVKNGHSPFRTWAPANQGLRMIFGYETVSVDNGDYGRFFFQEWNKGKSFSTAFLDASWRISTAQEPSVAACGASKEEASSRVFNERVFNADRANTSWWWWRWYDAARARTRNLRIPTGARSAKLRPASSRDLAAWAERFDVAVPPDVREQGLGHGVVLGGVAGARVAILPNGSREVRLSETADASGQISADQAIKIAQRAIEQYRLAENVDLILDNVRSDRHAGASADERVDESVREMSVSYIQVIDGVPAVTPDAGRVEVRVDNERTVTSIVDSTRPIQEVRDRPAAPPPPDTRRSRTSSTRTTASLTGDTDNGGRSVTAAVDGLLDSALQRRLRRATAGGRFPRDVRVVPNTTEVGYAMRDSDAVLVARREVELDFGRGLSKRYVIEEPIEG